MKINDLIACPTCKGHLEEVSRNGSGKAFHCGPCTQDYAIEAGVPVLLPAYLKNEPIPSNGHLSETAVKHYYIETERYDWVVDTRYPEKLFHILRERAIVENLKKYARGKIGLDLGCGTGLITRHIALQYRVGVDINRWALAKANEHVGDGVRYVNGDAENLPLASGVFDVVVCTDVLEHLLEPEKAVSNIFRVLRPGGVLVGTVPSKSPVWNYRKLITTTCPVCEPFHNNFSKNGVKKLLQPFDTIRIAKGALGLEWLFAVRKTTPGQR